MFSFTPAEYPAMTAGPKPLMTPWITRLPTEIKLCCRVLGTAMTRILRRSGREKRGAFFPDSGSVRMRLSTAMTASAQLTPWQRNVAQATPATPMPKADTNSRSMAMFAVEDTARKRKGVRESPRAAKVPVATL